MNQRPAFWMALFFALGIVLSRHGLGVLPLFVYGTTIVLCLLISWIFGRIPLIRTGLTALAVLILGMGRSRLAMDYEPASHLAHAVGNSEVRTVVHGWIDDDPSPARGPARLTLRIDSLLTSRGMAPMTGKVVLRTDTLPDWATYGRALYALGHLAPVSGPRNPGGYDAAARYRPLGIRYQLNVPSYALKQDAGRVRGNTFLRRVLYPLRHRLAEHLALACGPQACLLSALILGDRSRIDADQRNAFARTGLVHLLAVSGLHVGFLLIILRVSAALLRLNRPGALLWVWTGLALYTLLTQAQVPVFRAALMAGLYQFGRTLERPPDGLNLLGVAAWVDLALRPLDLFTPGFQLSFTAVTGLLTLYPLWKNKLKSHFQRRLTRRVIDLFLLSVAAQAATLPLVALHFHRLPLWSLPLNLLAVPWTGGLVALGLLTALVAFVWPWMASVYGALAGAMALGLEEITARISDFSLAALDIPPLPALFWIAYLLVLWGGSLLSGRISRRLWGRWLPAILLLTGLAMRFSGKRGDTVTWLQLDVGQGDAALLMRPDRHAVLIDGGKATLDWDTGERVILPVLRHYGIRQLDAVILSHPHADHLGGLFSVLAQVPVKRFISARLPAQEPLVQRLNALLIRRAIPHRAVTEAEAWDWDPARLTFQPPPTQTSLLNLNDQSLALILSLGTQRIAFLGDLEETGESYWLTDSEAGPCQAVKVPHHGAATSSSWPLVRQTRPRIAVISVGRHNRFGHPHDASIERWVQAGASVSRTDQEAALLFKIHPDTLIRLTWHKSIGRCEPDR